MLYSSRAYASNQDVVRGLTHTITSSPLIASLIEHIIVSEVSPSKSGIASTLPLLLVNRLPKLRTITVRNTTLLVNAAFCYSIASFPGLTTLTLCSVNLGNVPALRRLLTALPRLDDLTLEWVDCETYGMWETATLYESRMPRVRRLSLIDADVTHVVLPLLARHVERLVISFTMLKTNALENVQGLVFERLTSLTLRSYGALADDVNEFFSRSRADGLRTLTVVSLVVNLELMHRPEVVILVSDERSMLEQTVLKAGLPQLESVAIVMEAVLRTDSDKARAVGLLEEGMPAAVKDCRESMSVLHRHGQLRVAAVVEWTREDEVLVCLWPDEGADAAPSYTRHFGVSLLDAVVNVLEKTP
ncbi:hypothetical protein GSI_13369 [Ganoderma sinense ZZ0214-1]|uniref:Uncharacterized protein n=1 Tax=Ganoderma sinense ZZ0214-1 TaxID=1077348 RepID=A0A2G8RVE8_9APHY|nr:hypothetical protein GSI_13369 [Ganoderma sinense ZZ0214-1]